jgi:ribosomal-protein-alanine N-acetyltransferase
VINFKLIGEGIMKLVIEKLKDADFENLHKFEIENRTFFEEMIPSRGDDYYRPESFRARNELLLDEQAEGLSYFYLIKDEHHSILGRINLVDINFSNKIGFLGYRVGKIHTGKGIAKKALQLLLHTIIDLDIKEVHAKTTAHNIASQKVLMQNGFKHTVTSEEEFEMNGQMLQFTNYIWINKHYSTYHPDVFPEIPHTTRRTDLDPSL